jgi:hypothetical protein
VTRPSGAARGRPSTWVLLSGLPFAAYWFVTSDPYRRALDFIVPGVLVTIFAAVAGFDLCEGATQGL